MTTNPTRAVTVKSGNQPIAKAVWAWGQCTVITDIESYREPRLDTDNDIAVQCIIHCIKFGDPVGAMTFLWDDLLESHEAS